MVGDTRGSGRITNNMEKGKWFTPMEPREKEFGIMISLRGGSIEI